MRRYNFNYKIVTFSGDVVEGVVPAIHSKNAKNILKLRYVGCIIIRCKPADNIMDHNKFMTRDYY